jgi:hypothetical protein
MFPSSIARATYICVFDQQREGFIADATYLECLQRVLEAIKTAFNCGCVGILEENQK